MSLAPEHDREDTEGKYDHAVVEILPDLLLHVWRGQVAHPITEGSESEIDLNHQVLDILLGLVDETCDGKSDCADA